MDLILSRNAGSAPPDAHALRAALLRQAWLTHRPDDPLRAGGTFVFPGGGLYVVVDPVGEGDYVAPWVYAWLLPRHDFRSLASRLVRLAAELGLGVDTTYPSGRWWGPPAPSALDPRFLERAVAASAAAEGAEAWLRLVPERLDLDALRQLTREGLPPQAEKALRHLPRFRCGLVLLAADPRLWPHVGPQLLREAAEDEDEHAIPALLRDTLDIAERLGARESVHVLSSRARLVALHDALVAEWNRRPAVGPAPSGGDGRHHAPDHDRGSLARGCGDAALRGLL